MSQSELATPDKSKSESAKHAHQVMLDRLNETSAQFGKMCKQIELLTDLVDQL